MVVMVLMVESLMIALVALLLVVLVEYRFAAPAAPAPAAALRRCFERFHQRILHAIAWKLELVAAAAAAVAEMIAAMWKARRRTADEMLLFEVDKERTVSSL